MISPSEDEDDEFPVGDGTADLDAIVVCPYCWQQVEITLDPGGGSSQEYQEDCEICCRPWLVRVHYSGSGFATVTIAPAEE